MVTYIPEAFTSANIDAISCNVAMRGVRTQHVGDVCVEMPVEPEKSGVKKSAASRLKDTRSNTSLKAK